MTKTRVTILVLTMLALATPAVRADYPPPYLNYQGVLRDNDDRPLDGTYDMVFRFFSGFGEEIHIDRHTQAQGGAINVSGGLFTVPLGAGAGEDGSGPGVYLSLREVFRDYQEVHLEVQIGADGDPDREVLSPRTRVLAAAYAMNADSLAGLSSFSLLRSDTSDDYTSGTLAFRPATTLDVNGTLRMDGPVTRGSTDHVANFNADLLDGYSSVDFGRLGTTNSWSGASTFQGVPTDASIFGGSLVVNPSSAGANYTLLGVGVFGQERLRVDAEGDLTAAGSLNVEGGAPLVRLRNASGTTLSQLYSSDGSDFSYYFDFDNSRYMLYSNADGIGIGTNTVSSSLTTTTPGLWVSEDWLAVNGRIDMDEDGPDHTQSIYFYNNSSATSEYLRWDDAQDRFEASDELAIAGPIRTGTTSTTPVAYNHLGVSGAPDSPSDITSSADLYVQDDVEIDGMLMLNGNLHMYQAGSGAPDAFQYIYFWSGGSFSEFLNWSLLFDDYFFLSDDLQIGGNLTASGTKSFVQNHPEDPELSVVYVALEGDEAGTYTRGSGRLADGEARVPLGETFAWVTNPEIGLTAQITARSPDAALYVESISTTELVVRNVSGFPADADFDYLVHGLRIGFEDFQTIRPRGDQARIPAEAYYERKREQHPELQRYTAARRYASMAPPAGVANVAGGPAARALRASIGEYDPETEDPNPQPPPGSGPEVARPGDEAVSTAASAPPVPEAAAPPPESLALGVVDAGEKTTGKEGPESPPAHARLPVAELVEPGDLLVIDPDRPGLLRRASLAADAGVVGIVAGEAETFGDRFEAPVALYGLATVKADASYGAIRAGDLLTSSPTPGHAALDLDPGPGTVIGKALEPLDWGTGLIRVVVMLR